MNILNKLPVPSYRYEILHCIVLAIGKYRYICFAMATDYRLKTSPKAKGFNNFLQTNNNKQTKNS